MINYKMASPRLGAKYLAIPLAYYLLVKSLNKYYLNNELRYLYKQDLLVPWLRRIDDHQCSDRRDLRQELESSKMVDLSKSIVHKQLLLVESKGQGELEIPRKSDANARRKEKSNMNMIER